MTARQELYNNLDGPWVNETWMKGFRISIEELNAIGQLIETSLEDFGFLRSSLAHSEGQKFLSDVLLPRLHRQYPQLSSNCSAGPEYTRWMRKAVSALATRHKSKLLRRYEQRARQLGATNKDGSQVRMYQLPRPPSSDSIDSPTSGTEEQAQEYKNTVVTNGRPSPPVFASTVIYTTRYKAGCSIGRPAIGLPGDLCTRAEVGCSVRPEDVQWRFFIGWLERKLQFDPVKDELSYQVDDRKIFLEDKSELRAAFYDMYNLGRRRFEFKIETREGYGSDIQASKRKRQLEDESHWDRLPPRTRPCHRCAASSVTLEATI